MIINKIQKGLYLAVVLIVAVLLSNAANAQCSKTVKCSQASETACPCAETVVREKLVYNPEYKLEPKKENFVVSQRQGLFKNAPASSCSGVDDGSIFGGRPCKSDDTNGSIFGGGPCTSCDRNGSIFGGDPCEGEDCKPVENKKYIQNYVVFDDDLYKSVHQQCSDLAPFELEWVDFKIKNDMDVNSYSRKLGKYRFRIFGCRRDTKNAILNEGRIVEKDMNFREIFDDMVNDCYKLVHTPKDLCLNETSPIPEYVLTAEITNYFMNICDEYNWDKAQKEETRIGSSEMTITWRLMDPTKTNVFWKGVSTGYAELLDGEHNGEMILVERAFADAVSSLRTQPGFEDQLAKRVSPEEMERQKLALIALQRANNPIKCQFKEEIRQAKETVEIGEVTQSGGVIEGSSMFKEKSFSENSGANSSGSGHNESWIAVPMVGTVTESSNINSTGISENGGAIGGALIGVEPAEPSVGVTAVAFEAERLCIIEQPAYDKMSPENVYKVRASILSVRNSSGKSGAGLLLSENFVMTSADLIEKDKNSYSLETINGKKLHGKAIRVNPKKNTALLMLDTPTQYTPLPLSLNLPPIGKDSLMSLGLLNFVEGEGYLDNSGKVSSYRYSEDGTAEIVIDTFVQKVSTGGALIDENGRILGLAHTAKTNDNSPDLFLPIETAMKSLGLEICGKPFPVQQTPKVEKSWRKPVSEYIESGSKKPEAMKKKERK